MWLLASICVACSILAAYEFKQNKALSFKVQQLEYQLARRDVASAQLELIPQANCKKLEFAAIAAYLDNIDAAQTRCQSHNDVSVTQIDLGAVSSAQSHRIALEKYQLLLQSLTLAPEDLEAVITLFTRREALLNAPVQDYYADQAAIEALIQKQQEALANLDVQVAQLLSPDDREKYNLLKNSDFAQFQLNQLQQGLEESELLTQQQKGDLLLSKMAHQQNFEKAMAALLAHNSQAQSLEESKQLLNAALEKYKNAYFSDSSAVLGEEQFLRFKAFESAQFEALLRSLEQQISGQKKQ